MNTPSMTPDQFREFLSELSEKQFSSAKDDPVVQECLEAGESYTRIWEEAQSLHRSLRALEVPVPRVNIAASVMASIATERAEEIAENQKDSFGARIVELFNWQFQVPAWSVAAMLLLLIGSIGLNLLGDNQSTGQPSSGSVVAENTDDQSTPDAPQIIHVVPQTPSGVVSVSGRRGMPLSANPSPSLVIIMGAPSPSWLSDQYDYTQTSTYSMKENEI